MRIPSHATLNSKFEKNPRRDRRKKGRIRAPRKSVRAASPALTTGVPEPPARSLKNRALKWCCKTHSRWPKNIVAHRRPAAQNASKLDVTMVRVVTWWSASSSPGHSQKRVEGVSDENTASCGGNAARFGGPLGEAPDPPLVLSLNTSLKGSGSSSVITLFSIRSRSDFVIPGFTRSPLDSPRMAVPIPTPLVIQAGFVSRCAPRCLSSTGPAPRSSTFGPGELLSVGRVATLLAFRPPRFRKPIGAAEGRAGRAAARGSFLLGGRGLRERDERFETPVFRTSDCW